MRHILYYFILLFILLSCSSNISNNKINEIVVPVDQIPKISEFIDEISFISLPLEMNSGFFHKVISTGKYFIFADTEMTMKVFVLDKSFKIVSVISNYGEGPGEYLWIEGVNFNENKETIEILTNKNLIRYSIQGVFLESFEIPFPINNLVSISENDYIIQSNDPSDGFLSNSNFLLSWNVLSNKTEPIISHVKSEIALSTMDRNNMFRYNGVVYATHVYLDTVYKINLKKELSKVLINLSGQNIPIDLLKDELNDLSVSIWDKEDVQEKYAFHYPELILNNDYYIDKFIKRNQIYFFIFDNRTGGVISGRQVVDDVGLGYNFINPRFIDEDNFIYSIHQIEEFKVKSSDLNNSKIDEFISKIDSDVSFFLIKYKLK